MSKFDDIRNIKKAYSEIKINDDINKLEKFVSKYKKKYYTKDNLPKKKVDIPMPKCKPPKKDDDCHIECYWNYEGQCCPEGEEELDKAIMNSKDCPTYLRKDFEEHFWQTYDNICFLIKKRNCRELEEIEKFILGQREEN